MADQKVNLREAADNARNLGKMFASVLHVQSALETIADLQDHIEILTRRDKELNEKCVNAQATLSQLESDIVSADKNIEHAKNQAANIVHDAEVELQKKKDEIAAASKEYDRIKKIIEDMKAKF